MKCDTTCSVSEVASLSAESNFDGPSSPLNKRFIVCWLWHSSANKVAAVEPRSLTVSSCKECFVRAAMASLNATVISVSRDKMIDDRSADNAFIAQLQPSLIDPTSAE